MPCVVLSPLPEAAQAVRRLQAYMAATAYDMLGLNS